MDKHHIDVSVDSLMWQILCVKRIYKTVHSPDAAGAELAAVRVPGADLLRDGVPGQQVLPHHHLASQPIRGQSSVMDQSEASIVAS